MKQIEFYEAKLKYEIDSWDLAQAMSNGKDVVVVDTRSNEVYENEHIPTAINIPHREISEESVKSLDKNFLYVTYCDGIGCNASTKGAVNLSRLGFKTKELLGGLDWWKRDGYSTAGKNGQKRSNIICGC